MVKEKKRTRNWELIIAGGICILISLLHLLGVFEQTWLFERISTITLLVLGLFITSEPVNRNETLFLRV